MAAANGVVIYTSGGRINTIDPGEVGDVLTSQGDGFPPSMEPPSSAGEQPTYEELTTSTVLPSYSGPGVPPLAMYLLSGDDASTVTMPADPVNGQTIQFMNNQLDAQWVINFPVGPTNVIRGLLFYDSVTVGIVNDVALSKYVDNVIDTLTLTNAGHGGEIITLTWVGEGGETTPAWNLGANAGWNIGS